MWHVGAKYIFLPTRRRLPVARQLLETSPVFVAQLCRFATSYSSEVKEQLERVLTGTPVDRVALSSRKSRIASLPPGSVQSMPASSGSNHSLVTNHGCMCNSQLATCTTDRELIAALGASYVHST